MLLSTGMVLLVLSSMSAVLWRTVFPDRAFPSLCDNLILSILGMTSHACPYTTVFSGYDSEMGLSVTLRFL